MKLILVDRCKVSIQQGTDNGKIYFCSSITTSANTVTWEGCSRDLAKVLLSEIFVKTSWDDPVSYISIEAKHIPNGKIPYMMRVQCSNGYDVFKKLRELFHDKVKIFVQVACGPQSGRYMSSEEMVIIKIDQWHDMCEGIINEMGPYLYEGTKPGPKDTLLSIIAHIQDDGNFSDCSNAIENPLPRKILEDGLFTDLTIFTGCGTEVKAHKCFLSACSDVLQRNFLSGLKESQTNTLDMTDMSEKGVRAFLRYVYYQDLEEHKKDFDLAYELLCAAHKFNMSLLEEVMTKYLLERKDEELSVQLAFTLYTYLRTIESAAQLKAKAVQVLISNMDELEALPEYNELFQKTPDAAKELCRQLVDSAGRKK